MTDTYQRPELVSGNKVFRVATRLINGLGHYRSAPAEVGTPCPSDAAQQPVSRQHPATMSWTVESGVVAKEAANNSNLASECPRGSSAAPPAE